MKFISVVGKVAHSGPRVDLSAIWHYENFAELELLMGQQKALALLHIFQGQLAAYSEDLSDADGCDPNCQRIAHDVKSMGGQLGFNLLASVGERICRSPDQANEGDVRSLRAAIADSASAAQLYLEGEFQRSVSPVTNGATTFGGSPELDRIFEGFERSLKVGISPA